MNQTRWIMTMFRESFVALNVKRPCEKSSSRTRLCILRYLCDERETKISIVSDERVMRKNASNNWHKIQRKALRWWQLDPIRFRVLTPRSSDVKWVKSEGIVVCYDKVELEYGTRAWRRTTNMMLIQFVIHSMLVSLRSVLRHVRR